MTFLDSLRSRNGPILERSEPKNVKIGTQKSGSLSGIGEQSLNLVYTKFELLLAPLKDPPIFVPFLTFLDPLRSRIGPVLERNESKNDKIGTQKS